MWLNSRALYAVRHFFPKSATYRTGISPDSFDKQIICDYLETLDWPKAQPGPELPPEIIAKAQQRYLEAYTRLAK